MVSKLTYPGERYLDELMAITSKYQTDDAKISQPDVKNYMASFVKIMKSGVSISNTAEILEDHLDIVDATIEQLKENGMPVELAELVVNGWKEVSFFRYIWFLEPQSVLRAYSMYDELQYRICRKYAESRLEESLKIVDAVMKESPIPPVSLMFFYASRGQKSNPTKAYELAQKVYETSPNERALAAARAFLNDDELLYSYHWNSSNDKQRQSLSELKALDKGLTKEFGADYHLYGLQSKAQAVIKGVFEVFSEKAQEEKKALENYRDQLIGKVMAIAGLFGKSKYVSVYSDYLKGRIYAATDDFKSAINEFRSALDKGFAPHAPVVYLARIYLFRRKPDEARKLLEEWLPIFNFSPEDYDKQQKSLIQAYLDSGGNRARPPQPIDAKIKQQAKDNESKIDSYLKEITKEKNAKTKRFWDECYTNMLKLLDSSLEPQDYNFLMDHNGGQPRQVQISTAAVVSNHLDELVTFKDEEKELLIKSCYNPTNASDIAKVSATHLLANPQEWQSLIKEYTNLGNSSYLGVNLFNLDFGKNRIDNAREILKNFMNRKVFSEDTSRNLFTRLKDYFVTKGDLENKLNLEESFVNLFSRDEQKLIRKSFTETILELTAKSEKTLEKIKFLERGLAMDGNHEKIQQLLKSEKGKRNKMILIAVGVGLGVIVVIYLIDLIFNIF